MHFYTESYENLMRMPLRTFWLLSNNIDRIQAQIDLRQMSLNLRTGMNSTEESVGKYCESLIAETGEIVKLSLNYRLKLEAQRDEKGFEELRSMIR